MTSIAEMIAKGLTDGTDTTLPPMSTEDYEDQRAQWANEMAGSLTGVHCPECLDNGYIMERRGIELVSVECRCMAKRRSLWRMEKSGLGDMLERYTFDRFQIPEPWQQNAKRKALDYLSDHEGKWFVATGNPGSGKTHLCTAICGGLLNAGLEVRYMLWRDDAVRIKAAVSDAEEYYHLLSPLKRVQVLYIDDFFKAANVTSGDMNLAFELLNARYNRKDLVTIISTELSVDKILNIDEAVGSRIFERSKGYYLRFDGAAKNWRLRNR